jgi:hypothetical protein
MGYYTSYNLDVHKGNKGIWEILENLSHDDFAGLEYAVYSDGECVDSVKWYDHEADMKELSKQFPDIVFQLHGEGEEAGDIWYKYFKNGKMQECHAKITYDEFDESKLR